ncbi:Uncharacterized protein Fot_03472 [Forsythia ovata]|uniref:Uncharacterized protein n=1 Tax=Forsythia ovata TaxID=205694 RepID=A0ABD1X9T7_9LAMI
MRYPPGKIQSSAEISTTPTISDAHFEKIDLLQEFVTPNSENVNSIPRQRYPIGGTNNFNEINIVAHEGTTWRVKWFQREAIEVLLARAKYCDQVSNSCLSLGCLIHVQLTG